jgi:hypothetical protein
MDKASRQKLAFASGDDVGTAPSPFEQVGSGEQQSPVVIADKLPRQLE